MRNQSIVVITLLAGVLIGYSARFLHEPSSSPAHSSKAAVVGANTNAKASAVRSEADGASPLAERARSLPSVTASIEPPRTDEQLVNALRGAFSDSHRHRKHKAILDLLEYMTPENASQVRELFRESDIRGHPAGFRVDDVLDGLG